MFFLLILLQDSITANSTCPFSHRFHSTTNWLGRMLWCSAKTIIGDDPRTHYILNASLSHSNPLKSFNASFTLAYLSALWLALGNCFANSSPAPTEMRFNSDLLLNFSKLRCDFWCLHLAVLPKEAGNANNKHKVVNKLWKYYPSVYLTFTFH